VADDGTAQGGGQRLLPAPGLLVGVDLGTKFIKTAVVDVGGRELAWGQSPTPWQAVPTGAECEPEQLLDAVLSALSSALHAAPKGPVAGLGVTSIAETVVYMGADDKPVRPCIAWHDTRGTGEAEDLARTFGAAAFSARTGLCSAEISTLVKLAWLDRHSRPWREGRRAARALSIADWVAHRLGADQVSEASLACRTGALSLSSRQWWGEGLDWAGAPRDLFPPVVQAGEATGAAGAGSSGSLLGAKSLERLAGAALCVAGHDHLCAAVGAGATDSDQVVDSCGTAEALVRCIAPLPEAKIADVAKCGLNVSWHAVPGQQALLVGHSLGLLLDRVLCLLGIDTSDRIQALDAAAQAVDAGTLRVVQGGPYEEPSILGLHAGASPAALWVAALDAVAMHAPRIITTMDAIAGPARELVLGGGWARCAGLRRRKAGLLPMVRWPAITEAGARGAALFGGCAAGIFDGPSDFPPAKDQAL
jgi:sugar (pentulose or hexulose) kinase